MPPKILLSKTKNIQSMFSSIERVVLSKGVQMVWLIENQTKQLIILIFGLFFLLKFFISI